MILAGLPNMIPEPPEELMRGLNQAVFSYLEGKSAHSDIAFPLGDAIQNLQGASLYGSDPQNYGYVVVCANGVVFGFAEGMHGVTLRLPKQAAANARDRGAEARPAVGSEWTFFKLFGDSGFEAELTTLVREAFSYSASP